MPPKEEETWASDFEQLRSTPLTEIDPTQTATLLARVLRAKGDPVKVARFGSSI